jgi:glycosyltransferase involved in cell wall biosynthesis
MQPKNILFVHPTIYLNGVTRELADLINHLDRSRFRAFLAVPPSSALEKLIEVPEVVTEHFAMTNLGRHPARLARYLTTHRSQSLAIARFATRIQADVIFGNTILAMWALRAAKLAGRPCVMHIHEGAPSFPSFLYRHWVRRVGRQADKVLVVSKEIAAAFQAYASKVECVFNGIDLECFRGPLPKRRRPSQKGTDYHLLSVSHLMEGKGQHELVSRLPAIIQKCPGAHITFVGGTNDVPRNEEYFERLRRMASRLGVEDRVDFAGPQRDLKKWFERCDTFVNTSPYETFGLTLVEALAAGVPVVSRQVGIVQELINQRTPGLYVILESWDELPAVLEQIDADGYEDYRTGREQVLESYEIGRHVERIEKLLEQVIAKPRG